MPTKTKSRISKSGLSKKKGFKFKWWMGVVIAVIIAVVGIVVLRFSQAGTVEIFSASRGNIGGQASAVPTVGNGYNDSAFTSEPTIISIPAGGYAEAGESTNLYLSSGQSGRIRVCWYYFSSNSYQKRFTVELKRGGDLMAVDPDGAMYAPQSGSKCIDKDVSDSDGLISYRMVNTSPNDGKIGLSRITRQLLSISGGSQPQPPPGPPPAPPPPQCGQTPTAPCDFGNGNVITSVCGYQAVGPYASVCPGNTNQWQYIGLKSSFTGTWAQNQAKGVTHEHDVGYWQYKGLCGVKSHVIGDPILTKHAEPPAHFYLVGCPTTQQILDFKRVNQPPPVEKGTLYITKYGPHGPDIPNGQLKSNPETVPGNTGVCVKNKSGGNPFACSNQNPLVLTDLFVSDSPYVVNTTPPSGWKLSRTKVSGEGNFPNGFRWGNDVSAVLKNNQTTFVDIYYDKN